ncbi:MAG: acyl-CoA dehydrogenase [Proteobacteria bacterium]|nr:acyl-CoA dehydrogenase [Pseudomonadota bacterium]
MSQVSPQREEQDNETLELLRDSAIDFCSRSLDVSRLRSMREDGENFNPDLWREMCDLGWAGLLAKEELGGLGLSADCFGIICRELGRVVAPEPLIEIGSAVALLSRLDADKSLLASIMDGSSLVSIGLTEAEEYLGEEIPTIKATQDSNGYLLTGTARGISCGTDMDQFILAADLEGHVALFLVKKKTKGLAVSSINLADGSTQATINLSSVAVVANNLLSSGEEAEKALNYVRDLARISISAYLVGLSESVFDITLDYLKTRTQFGQPIGSFQALQHRAVDLFIQKVIAGSVLDETLQGFDREKSETVRHHLSCRAKYRANEAALLISREAVQMHGGMGYTEECNVGLFLNRALVMVSRLGTSTYHAERFGQSELVFPPLTPGNSPDKNISLSGEGNDENWNELEDDDFRKTVRHFFETEYPTEMRYPSKRPRWKEIKFWYLRLSEKGWVAPAWPIKHGGMGLSPSKMLIFIEEQERCGIGRAPDMGIQMVGPLLIKHGTEAQRARYLPQILAGEEVWCQGYSEPNAGSDLASLKTEALLTGDEFVINGQKTWTTLAQDATHMFCLARTSKEGKPQAGISFFLIDLDQPGVTIRPIKNLAGDEEFCEVFLDNVTVPADCLVGEINQGWGIAKALLSFERIFIGSPKQSQYAVKRLELIASETNLFENAVFRDKLTRLKLNVFDLESTYQSFAEIVKRGQTLGPDVSLLKIWGTETFARLSELMVEVAGPQGPIIGKIPFQDAEVDVMSQFYAARPATIYGGSNEIQRNIIAKGVLKLPSK